MKNFILNLLSIFLVSNLIAQEKPEGLFINSKAPDFISVDQNGNEIRLQNLLKQGPVVLVFYRGNWCPHCNKHLKKLQDSLQLIMEKGAQLIAITPEKMEGILKTIEKTNAQFSILNDENTKILKAYDVRFEVDEKTIARYKNSKIDLGKINGQDGKIYLPVPAVYIVSKEGAIVYRYFESDYRKRIDVKEILNQLD